MKPFFLLIKGTSEDAIKQMRERFPEETKVQHVSTDKERNTVSYRVTDYPGYSPMEEIIQKWFIDPSLYMEREFGNVLQLDIRYIDPFSWKRGTLLWYRIEGTK